MSYSLNETKIAILSDRKLFLIDSSAFIRIEDLWKITELNLLFLMEQSQKVHFFLSNEVCVELMKGPRDLDCGFLINHIINVDGSGPNDSKENKFLIKENGKTKYIVLNKISWQDYNQVLLCQNHPKLTLVSNDRKLLKSASAVIDKRIIGINALMDEMIKLEPKVKEYKSLKSKASEIFELKKVH